MEFKVGDAIAFLRAQPSVQSNIKRPLPPRTPLGEGAPTADGLWLEVELSAQDRDKGFVLRSSCVEAGDERPELSRPGFVQKCVIAELRFNVDPKISPCYILADFLVARAIIETDVTNAGPMIPDSDGVGPLQVSTPEWQNFISHAGELAQGFDDADRSHPIRQVDAAAYRMHSDMKALSALRTPAGTGDAFLPQFLDVLFAYLTNSPAAALDLRDAAIAKEDLTEPVTKILKKSLTDVQIAALHKARARFFGPETDARTLNDVINAVTIALDTALSRGFEDIKVFMPEAVPVVSVPEMGGAGATFMQKAPAIMRALMNDFQFADFHAAGILGNFGRETDGFRLFQERNPRAGRGGWGWAQWTGVRRDQFDQFCRDKNFEPKSDEANYGFLKLELQTTKRQVVPHLKATTTLDQATALFEAEFEAAGVVALEDRKIWARRAMSAFKGIGTQGTPAQTLQQQIDSGRITFASAVLKNELLGLNTGVKVTPKLQNLVLRLSHLARLHITSLVRSGNDSLHNHGRGVDIGNQEIAGALLPQIATAEQVTGLGIDELIFDAGLPDRNRFNFDKGARHVFDDETLLKHRNHIHFAVTA